MAFHAADTHRATSEGVARKGRLKERCGLEPGTNFFFRLRNRQKLVRIRFGCGLDSRIYGIYNIKITGYYNFLKHNVDYTDAVTEGQQTSDNFHRTMLRRHENPTASMKNP